jgi:hypothetical protein
MVSMKKYFPFLLLAFFFLVPNSFSKNQAVMNTSVMLASNVYTSVSTDKLSYCKPETVYVTNSIENRGNVGATGNLTTRILNPDGVEIQNSSWQNILVGGGEIKNFYLNHTVTDSDTAGMHTIRSNFTYDSKFRYAETQFRIKKGIGTLISSPSRIEKTMMPGDTVIEKVYFWLLYPCYGAYVYLNKTSGLPGDWITFSLNPLYISPELWNATEVNITVDLPRNVTSGDYSGYIFANANGQQIATPVIIHVQTSGVFDVSVVVPSSKKEVCQGSDVYATVTITKFLPSGLVDINMTYQITDYNNTIVDQKNETIAINTTVQRIPILYVPSSASPGYYTFTAILEYKELLVYASDIFLVKECPVVQPPPPSGEVRVPAKVEAPILLLNVSTHRLTTVVGNKTGFVASVKNIGGKNISSVELTVEGIPTQWITITPIKTTIAPNATVDYIALITIPKDADEGIYPLKVKATNEVESNEEVIVLIIGKDIKSAADLLLKELEKIRAKAKETLLLDCLDIGDNIKLFEDAEKIKESGVVEYNNKNYQKSIDLFDYAISLYEKIVNKANVLMKIKSEEIGAFMFPPYTEEIKHSIKILKMYAEEKNYRDFCVYVYKIQQLSFYSKIVLVLVILAIIASVALLIMTYRKKKEWERVETIEKIKERLRGVLGRE